MGSVIDYLACECGGERMIDWNYNTNEEHCFCSKCGKFSETYRYTDEDGEYVLEDAVTANGEPFKRLALKVRTGGGYGSARVSYKDVAAEGVHCFGSKEDVLSFKEQLQLDESELDLDRTYVFLYDPETQTGEVIYGHAKPQEGYTGPDLPTWEERLSKMETGNREELEIAGTAWHYDVIKVYITEAGGQREVFHSKEELLAKYPKADVFEGYTVFDPEHNTFLGKENYLFETIEEIEDQILPF